MDSTANIYSHAFSRWKATYDQLQHALESFLGECTRLDSAFRQPAGHDLYEREEILARLDVALTQSENWTSNLCSARATLAASRNRSHTMVPINRLPTETITYILSLVDVGCIIKNRYDMAEKICPERRLTSILAASKGLRQTAIGTHALWVHVDLMVGGQHQAEFMSYVRLCLRHSGQRGLHVHIYDDEDDEGGFAKDMVKLLIPEQSRITTLNIQAASYNATDIVLGIFNAIPSCQVKRFYLNCITSSGDFGGNPNHDEIFGGRLESLLSSIEMFSISGPTVLPYNPARPVLHGLTVLSIFDSTNYRPTAWQLRDFLACSPQLRALSLVFLSFRESPGVLVEPVRLPNLDILDLRGASAEDFVTMLSFIRPESSEVALSIGLEELGNAAVLKARDFIGQSRVTRLLLDDTANCMNLVSVLLEAVHPAVRELAFFGLYRRDLPDQWALATTSLPSLHAIHILGGSLDANEIRRLFESSTAEIIYAEDVSLEQKSGGFPWLRCRYYPTIGWGDDELEWPVKI